MHARGLYSPPHPCESNHCLSFLIVTVRARARGLGRAPARHPPGPRGPHLQAAHARLLQHKGTRVAHRTALTAFTALSDTRRKGTTDPRPASIARPASPPIPTTLSCYVTDIQVDAHRTRMVLELSGVKSAELHGNLNQVRKGSSDTYMHTARSARHKPSCLINPFPHQQPGTHPPTLD